MTVTPVKPHQQFFVDKFMGLRLHFVDGLCKAICYNSDGLILHSCYGNSCIITIPKHIEPSVNRIVFVDYTNQIISEYKIKQ